jgi:hypothetical protein
MKPKTVESGGNRIKVHRLRNSEMRAAHGGREYTCGGLPGDDCTELVIHLLQQQDEPSGVLLSVYKQAQSQ